MKPGGGGGVAPLGGPGPNPGGGAMLKPGGGACPPGWKLLTEPLKPTLGAGGRAGSPGAAGGRLLTPRPKPGGAVGGRLLPPRPKPVGAMVGG